MEKNLQSFTKLIYGLIFILLWPCLVQANEWSLVWSDEFDYTGPPNEAKWNYARQWCRQQGIGFRIVTEKEIFNKPQKARPQKKAKIPKVAKRKKR